MRSDFKKTRLLHLENVEKPPHPQFSAQRTPKCEAYLTLLSYSGESEGIEKGILKNLGLRLNLKNSEIAIISGSILFKPKSETLWLTPGRTFPRKTWD